MVTCHVLFQCPVVGKLINKKVYLTKTLNLNISICILPTPLLVDVGLNKLNQSGTNYRIIPFIVKIKKLKLPNIIPIKVKIVSLANTCWKEIHLHMIELSVQLKYKGNLLLIM